MRAIAILYLKLEWGVKVAALKTAVALLDRARKR
jgi:hypothetical protein